MIPFMTGKELLDRLNEEVVVGDGAMGTMLHAKGVSWEMNFDSMNLLNPELVKSIHLEYMAAGARFIETNTFGANRNKLASTDFFNKVREVNLAGARLIKEVATKGVCVAGSVGPLGRPRTRSSEFQGEEEKIEIFKEQAQALCDGGVDCLVLESFPSPEELQLALKVVRAITDLPVLCQMAVLDRLDSDQETWAAKNLLQLKSLGADCIGGNCGSGPAYLLKVIQRLSRLTNSLISAFPNLSFPQYMEGRYVYISDPEYFAESALKLADAGANLIGGCCGTTPHHIRLVNEKLLGRKPAARVFQIVPFPQQESEPVVRSPLVVLPSITEKVQRKTGIIVELDPPRGLGHEKVVEGARALAKEGVDAISIAENPLASIRMNAIVLAYLVQKETGVLAIPHLTCRDRNLLGQQSELMGAWALGINHLLAITGDPTSIGGALGCSSVFDTNSFGLIEMIIKLNQGINIAGSPTASPTDFIIGCAFDPNKTHMEAEIKRLRKKISLGAQFVQSQIVFSPEKIVEMYGKIKDLSVPVFCGIMPLVNHRNAEFLHNEVPGFRIPEEVRLRMKACGEDKQKGIKEGLTIARELIDAALECGAPGIYMVTPFNKWQITAELTRYVREKTSAKISLR